VINVEFDGKWWGIDWIRDHLKVTQARKSANV
jgi:hypothetical protein